MNTAPWPQEIVVKPMDEIITNTNNNNKISTAAKPQPSTCLERKGRPQKEQALNCPRCNSTNTKFCYYNNYSLTQPRYFCKTCRRYWTEGGSLRNIPVGGGSRKNKRPASSAFPSSRIKLPPDLVACTNPNSKIHEQGQDLNLGFPSTLSEFMQLPNMENLHQSQSSALELLTAAGLTSNSRGFNLMTPFMGMQIPHHPTSAFPSPPASNFTLDGLGNQESAAGIHGGRILFPFEHLKSTLTTSSTAADEHHHNHNSDHQQGDSTGYWTGILGGAGSW